MTVIAATAVFAFVFILLLVGLTSLTQSAEQNRQVSRRMIRPNVLSALPGSGP